MILDGDNTGRRQQCRWAMVVMLVLGMASTTRVSIGEEMGSLTKVTSDRSPAATVPPAPSLIQDTLPATAFAMVGDQVTFTTLFKETPDAIFQWQKISSGVVNDLPGATTATLTLTNLQLSDTASYRLIAFNATNREAITYTSSRPLVVKSLPAPVTTDLLVIPSWAKTSAPPGGIWRTISLVDGDSGLYQAQLKIRGGAILPAGAIVQNTGENSFDPLTLIVCGKALMRAQKTFSFGPCSFSS